MYLPLQEFRDRGAHKERSESLLRQITSGRRTITDILDSAQPPGERVTRSANLSLVIKNSPYYSFLPEDGCHTVCNVRLLAQSSDLHSSWPIMSSSEPTLLVMQAVVPADAKRLASRGHGSAGLGRHAAIPGVICEFSYRVKLVQSVPSSKKCQ